MIQVRTTAASRTWNINFRNRVGDSVEHIGSTWVNITGKNSAPSLLSLDWDMVSSSDTLLKVENFVASHNQSSFFVSENAIDDDGLWSVQVGSALLNSTTGITSFVNGGITINFVTGEITFINPLQGGTQVIIKYN